MSHKACLMLHVLCMRVGLCSWGRLGCRSMGWSGSPPYWSVGAGVKCECEPSSVISRLFFPGHITRTSLSPPFSSPWPTLEPKKRPKGHSHRQRQIIKVLILRSAKGLLLTLVGNRPQGIRPCKASSRKRVIKRAERNRFCLSTPSETPTPQVCALFFVLYGSQAKLSRDP